MKFHGNSLKNDNPHHLYEIYDEADQEIFKYGISDDPIEEDGLSARLRKQVSFMNLVANAARFIGRILIKGIPGRRKAKDIETGYIQRHIEKKGKRPRGNIRLR